MLHFFFLQLVYCRLITFFILQTIICEPKTISSIQSSGLAWDCSRTWPKLELFIPVILVPGGARNDEWVNVFLRTYLLFWPTRLSGTTINLIVDVELRNSALVAMHIQSVIKTLSAELGDNFPKMHVTYHDHVSTVYKTGHDRQQFLMFNADNYTSADAEFIGFMDSDALFHSFVDREDLFENGKAIINGRIGRVKNVGTDKNKREWMRSTWAATGLEEPMICMSYFPVIIKKRHMKDIRDFINAHLGTTDFDASFGSFAAGGFGKYSQFNIFCAYLFWKRKEEYTWYIHDTTPWWDGHDPEPAFAQWSEKYVYDNSSFVLKPYLSQHLGGRYQTRSSTETIMKKILFPAMCWRIPNSHDVLLKNVSSLGDEIYQQRSGTCNEEKNNSYFKEMHRFEDMDFNLEWFGVNASHFNHMHKERHTRTMGCNHTYIFI